MRQSIIVVVLFKEVVLVLKFIRNFTNKELSPSVKNVKSCCFVMRVLFLLHLSEFVRESQHLFVCVHVSMLLVFNALLWENSCHRLHIFIRAPMNMQYFSLIISKLVLWTSYNTKIWSCTFVKTDWNFHLYEPIVIGWILHLLDNSTLLHLSSILFLNDTY